MSYKITNSRTLLCSTHLTMYFPTPHQLAIHPCPTPIFLHSFRFVSQSLFWVDNYQDYSLYHKKQLALIDKKNNYAHLFFYKVSI